MHPNPGQIPVTMTDVKKTKTWLIPKGDLMTVETLKMISNYDNRPG